MIRLTDIHYSYSRGEPVLQGFGFESANGLTLVVGPNGCGKSTFLKIAAGVERPDRGQVRVDGLDLWKDEREARRRLSYVPEHPDLTPYATVLEILRLVCRLRSQPLTAATDRLHAVGLEGLGRRSIRELSLGQRRRAVLAAAMIGPTGLLVMDEPLEGMDRGMRRMIREWVEEKCGDGAVVLLATHEIEVFSPLAARAVTVREGRAVSVDPLPSSKQERSSLLEGMAAG